MGENSTKPGVDRNLLGGLLGAAHERISAMFSHKMDSSGLSSSMGLGGLSDRQMSSSSGIVWKFPHEALRPFRVLMPVLWNPDEHALISGVP